eukprot:CAMPEP_0202964866 /NCGR_PEP_ID=MMETSP1396-20130829/8981_1 /ASSEMBLY_ACC=CAM_ASM_000872 /TAXON_ID= /ORGANISM="Pseudokeronopsis sp., Strain Brazil" /LENGTH=217 /DNA_ID=CAMNT_0049687323 /DNA_START=84 /DNA_END=737 /DNA_ORIENTATION=+
MKWTFLSCIVLFFLLISIVSVRADDSAQKESVKQSTNAKRKEKDWNKLNVNDLDKEWEHGDESDELEDEFEKNRKIQARKQPKLDMNDGASIQRAYKADPFAFSGGGGQMVFVDLTAKQATGKPWTKNDVDQLCKKYSTLLKSGSIPAYVYNIDIERILVHIEKPWQMKDMLTFLSQQREVKQFTANSKTYTRSEWKKQFGDSNAADDDDDEDDDEF